MDQTLAPLLTALADYHAKNRYGFTPPAHRQGRGVDEHTLAVMGKDPFRDDVVATSGLDDRSSSNGYLTKAQELMADAVGAEQCMFTTAGSSLSVKAAMLSVAGHSGSILMSRDAHKSVAAGLIFSGMQPAWIPPRWDGEQHLTHPVSPAQVEKAWENNPDAAACLVVSPSHYGTSADLRAIVDLCHKRGKPVIVDEAWGAHLPFHEDLPTWAMDAGADICVVSVHKMGLGFEQGSVFHLQGDLIDPAHLSACADLLMTTSPNTLIYAAIDGWRRHMALDGREVLGAALELARKVHSDIEQIEGLHVLRDEFLAEAHELDELRLVIDLQRLGITGYQATDWLRENHHIDMGLSDHRRIGADISQSDDEDTVHRLLEGLKDLAAHAESFERPPQIILPEPGELELEQADLPRDAFFGECEMVPADEAVGRIAGEMATPYPPGTPAFIPGERLNERVLEYLRSGLKLGMNVPDVTDPTLETIRVRKER
ncbi:aminotransferase class I/II-fold pyridoxal phosphate-dependent enzyme [Naasia sp. SYSU D00057]|uniref:aminotransferase class I/II-fold pyridoxal phosphate-dependent enzyme n=1 Tax=Naasia sp. SYSU D00057 TaxID=2817380 RepID=UPI001B30A103|nr:aminotransferase class V-fold PLP-dependent enzyme [Naasia sp. SYSU D00057]